MQSNPFSTRFIGPGAIPFLFPPETAELPSETADVASEADVSSKGYAESKLKIIVEQICGSPASLIVGPHGSGKTTLLHTLRPCLESRHRHIETILLHSPSSPGIRAAHIHRRQNILRVGQLQNTMPAESLLIIDGIEQLSGRSRRRIVHLAETRGQRILATSHSSLPEFNVLYRTRVQPQVVESIVSLLTENASGELRKQVLRALDRKCLTRVNNVRDLLFELYDVAAIALEATRVASRSQARKTHDSTPQQSSAHPTPLAH